MALETLKSCWGKPAYVKPAMRRARNTCQHAIRSALSYVPYMVKKYVPTCNQILNHVLNGDLCYEIDLPYSVRYVGLTLRCSPSSG